MAEREKYNPADYKPESIQPSATQSQEKDKSKILRTFLIVVGIISLIFILMVIGAIIALIIIKPYGLDVTKLPAAMMSQDSDQPSSYDHPMLSTEQEKKLEALGIDTKTIPTQITPAQEKCAIDSLGADRVNQIKSGDAPSVTDYLKAKSCF